MNRQADMKKVNIGIIRCSHWGLNYVRNFSLMPQANVCSVSGLNSERLVHIKQLYPKLQLIKAINPKL